MIFDNMKAELLKDEQSGKAQKDYMTRWFMRAGWVGDDDAPRIGQAYIDLESEINEFKANNDGRRPNDLKLQAMIQEKMGDYDYVKRLENEFPIAPDALPKPAAGEALGVRIARALNIAGYFKGAKTFAGGTNSKENRTTFRKAAQRIDLDVEIYKAAHGGQISDRRELAIINRIANDLVYVDGLHEDTPVLRATLDPNVTAGNKVYVLVGPKGTDKVYYHQLLSASKADKQMMAHEIGRTGVPESTVNLARIYLNAVSDIEDPHREFRSKEPVNQGTGIMNTIEIQNPSGGKNTTTRELKATSKGLSVGEMETMTPSIKKDYGPLAESAWEMLIEGKRQRAQHTEDMNRLDDLRKGLKTGPMQELR
jgi:hypothetical protein